MDDRPFLDTNILVSSLDTEYPDKQKIAQDLILEAVRSGRGALSTQVLCEFYVVVTRKIENPIAPDLAQALIRQVSILPVVEQSLSLVHQAIDLCRKHRTSFWDSLIIAAARQAGCGILYSDDLNHGQRYGGLVVVNPFR